METLFQVATHLVMNIIHNKLAALNIWWQAVRCKY